MYFLFLDNSFGTEFAVVVLLFLFLEKVWPDVDSSIFSRGF